MKFYNKRINEDIVKVSIHIKCYFHSFKYQRKTNLKIDPVITDMSWVYYEFKTKNKA